MYATTDLYKTLLADPLHWKETKLDIAGTEYTEANIISAVIPPAALYEKFGIGNCVARELDLEVFPIGDIPRQAKISVYVRLVLGDQVSEWIPQGVFFISTRKKNKLTGALVITAFDAMLKAEDTWLTEDYDLDDWPKSQQEAVEDIAQRMGIEVDPRTELSNDFPVDYPVDEYGDLTMREVLSGIGVSNAANWIITMEGKLLQIGAVETLDSVSAENNLSDMDVGDLARPVSKVILNVDGSTYYQAGDDTGNTIEADCPWATQAMTNSVLEKMQGYTYQPFSGSDALLDPAAELGDAITVGGLTAALALLGRNLDRQGSASVGAPDNDEIEDEYPYKSKQRKQTDRQLAQTRSAIEKSSEVIKLIVEELGGSYENYTELELNLDGVFVRDETGATRITGSCIETSTLYVDAAHISGTLSASQINMTGAITWNDLSSGVQSTISSSGGYTKSEIKTFISEELVASPNIAGGKFWNLDMDTWVEVGDDDEHYGLTVNNNYWGILFGVYDGDMAYTSFCAKLEYYFLLVDGDRQKSIPRGTWDFSEASVTGFTAVWG